MRKILSLFAAVLFAGSMMAATAMNCAEAAAAAQGGSTEEATITGYVTSIAEKWSSQHKNVSFWMADTKDGGQVFEAFRVVCETEAEAPGVGDKVQVTGTLAWFAAKSIAEIAAGGSFVILEKAGGGGGEGGDEVVLDVAYADAAYSPTDGDWWFDFYKDYNADTQELTYPEVQLDLVPKSATAIAGTYGIDEINWGFLVLAAGDTVEMVSISDVVITYAEATGYHYAFSFTGDDNKTYKIDADLDTWAYNYDTEEDITLDEDGGGVVPPTPEDLATEGIHTLTPDTDNETSTEGDFSVVIDGIQLAWHGAYVKSDFRVFAGKDLTITAGANIVKVEIAGKANKDGFTLTANHGTITTGASYEKVTEKADIEDPLIVVDEIGSPSVKLTCGKQLRAYSIRVTLEGAQGIEETLAEGKAVKVVREGNVLILKGDKAFNVMGQIVK